MQVHKGIAALLDFRRRKLLHQLPAIDTRITSVTAEYVHFVDTAATLPAKDERRLRDLLTYGSLFGERTDGEIFQIGRAHV